MRLSYLSASSSSHVTSGCHHNFLSLCNTTPTLLSTPRLNLSRYHASGVLETTSKDGLNSNPKRRCCQRRGSTCISICLRRCGHAGKHNLHYAAEARRLHCANEPEPSGPRVQVGSVQSPPQRRLERPRLGASVPASGREPRRIRQPLARGFESTSQNHHHMQQQPHRP